MKKILSIGIILLFFGLSITPISGISLDKQYIKPISNGNTLYVGGSGPGNYSKIQDAINDSSDGDTVFVYADSSPYYENIVIDKSIMVIGEDRNTTIIDCQNNNELNKTNVILINSNNCTIKEFKIIGPSPSTDWVGIHINSSNNSISNNLILNNYNGVYIGENSKNNIVLRNSISYNLYGIFTRESNNNNISINDISSSSFYGIYLSVSDNNVIFGNTVSKCDFYGIRIKASDNNKVYRNTILENKRGVYLCCGSANNVIYHNNLKQNIEWNARDDVFNQWDNGRLGNYWDDYNGTDADGDGIGDTPYLIPDGYGGTNNEDRYPLMAPYGMTKLLFSYGGGTFKISVIIKNMGNNTAFNVQWKITLDGGIILLGRESSGIIPKPLLSGEETTVSTGLIFGFGTTILTITVWADNAPLIEYYINAFLFLFYIKINPGGG